MFKVMSTKDVAKNEPSKTLLYAHHGFGKTYQCRNYEKRYGRGLIISGEAGLKSLADTEIDYLPFTSWDGETDEERGVYSFRKIWSYVNSPEFVKAGYKWIAIDSLTEMSERLLENLEKKHSNTANGFVLWGDYSRIMTGALKAIRDLPVHVLVTCLAKEEKDANDNTQYWPLLKGNAVSKHTPALFDNVFCGVRTTENDGKNKPTVARYIVTDEVSGWHGKARDPLNRLSAYEKTDDITELLARMSATEDTKKLSKKSEENL